MRRRMLAGRPACLLPTSAAGLRARGLSAVAGIDASRMTVELSKAPKAKPALGPDLAFGVEFTDHMMTMEWDRAAGFAAPQIVQHGPLALDPACPGLNYGAQCFEGMKAYKDAEGRVRMFRPDLNMARFNASCARLCLPTFDGEQLIECLKELLRVESAWVPDKVGYSLYLRPVCIGTTPTLGVTAADQALLYAVGSPVGPYFKDGFAPVKLLAENSYKRAWPGGTGDAKVGGNYAPAMLPQQKAAAEGCAQVLWLFGEDDLVTEIGAMNAFVYWVNEAGEDELITAPLDGTILPGVTRSSVISLAEGWGDFKVTERPFSMAEVSKASDEGRLKECFGAGTAAVVAPINGLRYKGVDYEVPCGADGKAGPITKRVFDTLTDIQYGRVAHEWSVIV